MTPEIPVDPILRHPWAALRSEDVDETSRHLGDVARTSLIGSVAGLGAGYLAVQLLRGRAGVSPVLRHMAEVVPMKLVGAGIGLGGGLGATVGEARHLYDRMAQHDAAARRYEQAQGAPLPFAVRHPYLLSAAAPLTGAALGAAVSGPGAVMRTLGGGAGLLVGGLAGGPLLANVGADARRDYFDRPKQAAENPILLHPTLVKRPTTVEEAEDRGRHYAGYIGAGAALGALGGGAAAMHFLPKAFETLRPYKAPVALGGAALGAMAGAALGAGGAYGQRYMKAISEHDAAAREYEGRTGETLPFAVRHPHAMLWGPVALGAAAGAAYGSPARLDMGWLSRPYGGMAGLSIAAGAIAPLAAAYSYQQRKNMFGGRVGHLSTETYGSDFDSDVMTLDQRQKMQQAQELQQG